MATRASTWEKVRTSVVMQGREYRYRLLPLVMVALLPVAFWAGTYFSAAERPTPLEQVYPWLTDPREVPERETWPIDIGVLGVGWAVAAAALFSIIGSGARDRRLILCGYRAWQIGFARWTVLLGIAVVVSVMPLVLTLASSAIASASPGLVWLGSFFMATIALGIGLVIGSVLPRPLEGTLVIIGLFGTLMSMQNMEGYQYLPTGSPAILFSLGRFGADGSLAQYLGTALGWTVGVNLLAMVVWTRRARLRR